jgi:hypothetical protein
VSLCLERVHGAFGCASDVSGGGVVIGDFVEYGQGLFYPCLVFFFPFCFLQALSPVCWRGVLAL